MSAPRTAMQEIERVRNGLAFFLVGAFVGMLPFMLYRTIPTENKEILVYMIGQLSGMATMALGFYFTNKIGQDALDAQRSDNTGKLAEAVTTALKVGPVSDGEPVADVILEPGETAQAKDVKL